MGNQMETEKIGEIVIHEPWINTPEIPSDEGNEAEKIAQEQAKVERLAQISQDEVIGDSAIAAANLKKQYITDSTTAETKKAIEDIAQKIENEEITIEEWQEEAKKMQKWWFRRTTDLFHITNSETGRITTGAKVVWIGWMIVGWFFALRAAWRWIFGWEEESEEEKVARETEKKAKALAEAQANQNSVVPPTNAPAPTPTMPTTPVATNAPVAAPVANAPTAWTNPAPSTPATVDAHTWAEEHPLAQVQEHVKQASWFVAKAKKFRKELFE